MRLDETSDTIRPRLEVLIISRSEHVGMRCILNPCFYIRSGHVAKLFYIQQSYTFPANGRESIATIQIAWNSPRLIWG